MTEHAPEQLDAEFQVEKLTPDLVSKIIRQDITQPEILSQRWDLEDCTFIIPLRICLLYTSPSPRDATLSRMPSSA